MDIVDVIKERRSVRNYKDEVVDREIIKEIVDISRWSPSWANFQVARYTAIDNPETIKRVANEGVNGFVYNLNTLKDAKGLMVLSFVKGKSGKISDDEYATTKGDIWEVFDAGIACQSFCLAAHSKGVGTCIMGVIDDKKISEIINLPEEETVAAIIVYGIEEGDHAEATPRKDIKELLRFSE